MKISRTFLLVGLLSGVFLFTAQAADFGGVGGSPANPDPNIPHSKEWFIYALNPGEKKEDVIIVRNNDEVAVDVLLYPADSDRSTDGGFALKQFVEPKEKVGKWITLSVSELHLEPGEAKEVPFTIEIPNDPQLDVGEHTGGILIQKKNQQPIEAGGGMQLLTRVGVRVYVTLPGEIIKKLEITDFKTKLDSKRKMYTVSTTIRNSGNISQEITIKTRVTNLYPWLGYFFKEYPLENSRNLQVLRDDSLISNFEFKKPFWGKLSAEGILEYDANSKILNADPETIRVPLDTNIMLLIILILLFLLCIATLLILKKYGAKKKKKKISKKRK